MTRAARIRLFLGAVAVFIGLYLWALTGLPAFGEYHGPYGYVLNRIGVPFRHATDIVSIVNFDARGLDTIGEEFILFASVTATTLLLRREGEEQESAPAEDNADEADPPATSPAVVMVCTLLIPVTVVLGLYIVSHGQVSPGGGFQGGTVLAGVPVLIFLAGRYHTLKAVTPHTLVDVGEALGAGGFVAIGFAGLIAGSAFLENIVPLGPTGTLISAGTIPLINLAVGLEVSAGILLMLSEFLKQTLQLRRRGKS